jgi:hypothetical protein
MNRGKRIDSVPTYEALKANALASESAVLRDEIMATKPAGQSS